MNQFWRGSVGNWVNFRFWGGAVRADCARVCDWALKVAEKRVWWRGVGAEVRGMSGGVDALGGGLA